MDEYEKELESIIARKWVPNYNEYDDAYDDGYRQGTEDALDKYRSMTCKMKDYRDVPVHQLSLYRCESCGTLNACGYPNYCPDCGRKVQHDT